MLRAYHVVIIFVLMLAGNGVSAQNGEDEDISTEIAGSIAFIGNDRNTYLFVLETGETYTLTDDANMSQEGYKYYLWPTWSTDGRLAYFAIEDTPDSSVTTQVYVSTDGIDDGKLIYSGKQEIFNYASWSPGNCSDTENCRALSVLLSGSGGLFVEMIRDQVEGNPSEVVGRGGPFYYSWSPDGQQMLWQRNNRRLDIYNVDSGDIDFELEQSPGAFQAPDWSPVDNRWLIGELDREAAKTDLVVVTDDEKITLVDDLDGVISFAWSPDGEYVAFVDSGGPLTIVDSTTGEVVSRTVGSGVASYFWSPDSSRLAYITLATPRDSSTAKGGLPAAMVYQDVQIAWSVIEVETGNVNRYGAFTPTQDMVYMFTYFDQFAQSHSIWSPDSRYIVYSEMADDGAIINILDIYLEDTVPLSIADGRLAIWSFD